MELFTLPSLDVVFELIEDRFGAPKRTTRREVMERYHFVFVRDRVGRLADAQEFEGLVFKRRTFPEPLLDELLASSASVLRVEGERVVLAHCYTERQEFVRFTLSKGPLRDAFRSRHADLLEPGWWEATQARVRGELVETLPSRVERRLGEG